MARAVTIGFSRSGATFDIEKVAPASLTELLNSGQGDSFTIELIPGLIGGHDRFIADSSAFNTETTLDLSLCEPRRISTGSIVFGYSGEDSLSIRCEKINVFTLRVALNNLPAIHSAGGVDVLEVSEGVYRVEFQAAGSRTAISMTHSEAGAMADRVTESTTGDGSTKEVQTLDLRVQNIATVYSWSALSAATLTASVVTSGTSTVFQHERITLSRVTEGGSFVVSADGGDTWSDPVSIFAGAYQLQIALDAIAPDSFIVERGPKRWDVYRTRVGAVTSALQVRSLGLSSHAGKTATVDWSAFRRVVALTGDSGSRAARFVLRTGGALTGSVLDSGITLIDQEFSFHPALVGSPSDSALNPV